MSLNSTLAIGGYDRRQLSSRSDRSINLPRIEHPSKRMNDDQKYSLDIRGRSRDGQGHGQIIRQELTPRKIKRSSSLKYNSKSHRYRSEQLQQIPENFQMNFAVEDRDEIRLPIFGEKRSSSSKSSSSINDQTKENNRKMKLEIDQLEFILRDKVRSQMHDVRTKFRHAADQQSNGKINRQALKHIIATIFGTQKQISHQQIDLLLQRFNFSNSNQIRFIYSSFSFFVYI